MAKQMVISVIQVGEEQSKGNYTQFEIAYKASGKVEGKVFRSFVHPEVYQAAKALKVGDVATVTLDKELGKDGKEYWQWTALAAGGDVAVSPAASVSNVASSAATAAGKPAGRVTGSNYETPDERAARQVNIVRQSCLGYSLKFFEQTNSDVAIDDVIILAEKLKEFVFNGLPAKPEAVANTPKRTRVAKKAEDIDDDIPF
jgi:hypothetical protein